jgi:hypothetical protein
MKKGEGHIYMQSVKRIKQKHDSPRNYVKHSTVGMNNKKQYCNNTINKIKLKKYQTEQHLVLFVYVNSGTTFTFYRNNRFN